MNTASQKIITLTKAVRVKQREYFATRNKTTLAESKTLEKELDKALVELETPNNLFTPGTSVGDGFTNMFKLVSQTYLDHLTSLRQLNKDNGLEVVYVSGKVTGLPYADVKFKFENRKLELEALGYVVINPCDLIDKDTDWHTAMAICIALLPYANRINLLHDWQESAGAILERELAEKLGIKPLYVKP